MISGAGRVLAGFIVGAALGVGALILVTRGAEREEAGVSGVVPERVAEPPPRAAALEPGERSDPDRDAPLREAVRPPAAERASAAQAGAVRAESATGSALVVSVAGTDGLALPGALTTLETRSLGGYRDRRGHEVAPGRFRYEALDPGGWTFTARMPGYVDGRVEIDVPEHGPDLAVELVLERRNGARIRLETPAGEPLAKAARDLPRLDVIAAQARAVRLLDEVLGESGPDACGRFDSTGDLEQVPRRSVGAADQPSYAPEDYRSVGWLELACEPPLWVHVAVGRSVVAAQRLEPGVDELLFVLDPLEVAGFTPNVSLRIVDEPSGAPLGGARVRLGVGFADAVIVTTPASGALELRAPAGDAKLSVELLGYEDVQRDVVLPRAASHDLGTIALRPVPAAELVVEVRQPPGEHTRPVMPSVCWAPLEEFAGTGARPRFETRKLRTRDELSLPLGVGRYVVWCDGTRDSVRYGAPRQVVDLGGGTRRVVLELARKHEVALAAPHGPRRVRVLAAEGGFHVAGPATCGADGLGLSLLPGSYRVEVADDAGSSSSLALVVRDGPTSLELP